MECFFWQLWCFTDFRNNYSLKVNPEIERKYCLHKAMYPYYFLLLSWDLTLIASLQHPCCLLWTWIGQCWYVNVDWCFLLNRKSDLLSFWISFIIHFGLISQCTGWVGINRILSGILVGRGESHYLDFSYISNFLHSLCLKELSWQACCWNVLFCFFLTDRT